MEGTEPTVWPGLFEWIKVSSCSQSCSAARGAARPRHSKRARPLARGRVSGLPRSSATNHFWGREGATAGCRRASVPSKPPPWSTGNSNRKEQIQESSTRSARPPQTHSGSPVLNCEAATAVKCLARGLPCTRPHPRTKQQRNHTGKFVAAAVFR